MKKIIVLLTVFMMCLIPTIADAALIADAAFENKPKPKGYNYAKNQNYSARYHKKQRTQYINMKGHVCCGHRYKKQR